MIRLRTWFAPLACAALGTAATLGAARAVDADKFAARTTNDMVALCEANPNSQNYVAAIHFCHGFASGAFQYYLALAATAPENKFVCLPDPEPTRGAAIADFVAWTKGKSDVLAAKPVDSMFRFLGERYPCKK